MLCQELLFHWIYPVQQLVYIHVMFTHVAIKFRCTCSQPHVQYSNLCLAMILIGETALLLYNFLFPNNLILVNYTETFTEIIYHLNRLYYALHM